MPGTQVFSLDRGNKLFNLFVKDAYHILEGFPLDFEDRVIRRSVIAILWRNKIDFEHESGLLNSRKQRILNEKALLDGILHYHLAELDEHLFCQYNWIEKNDYPSKPETILLRQNFYNDLSDILKQRSEVANGVGSLKQNLKIAKKISDKINNTDLSSLKDMKSFDILESISEFLKLCVMFFSFGTYYSDPIVKKWRNGHISRAFWTGKTLNDTHFEYLEETVDKIKNADNVIRKYLLIDEQPNNDDTNHSMRL